MIVGLHGWGLCSSRPMQILGECSPQEISTLVGSVEKGLDRDTLVAVPSVLFMLPHSSVCFHKTLVPSKLLSCRIPGLVAVKDTLCTGPLTGFLGF